MILILFSEEDPASMNIYENLLNLGNFDSFGDFEGKRVLNNEKYYLIKIEGNKTYANFIDIKLKKSLKISFDSIIVASKHESKQKIKSLTVHPVGNFNTADLGGLPKILVGTDPSLMSQALRIMKENKVEGYQISLEVTHHGPALQTDTFFIEIGASEKEWNNKDAGYAIAKTIMSLEKDEQPTFISFGGGHYAPQVTDLVLKNKLNVGHMASKYTIEFLDRDLVDQMIEKSHNPSYAYFVKNLDIGARKKLEGLLINKNLKILYQETKDLNQGLDL
ncbi:MAG: D-aminoacyl-tRNA deacylase [Thermoplasmata archaeon]